MGLDVGTKTVGVAVADELGFTAQPITVVRRSSLKKDLAELLAIANERGVDRFVIGLPLNMDGSEGPRAVATRTFGDALGAASGLPIIYQDERLTTVAAARTSGGVGSGDLVGHSEGSGPSSVHRLAGLRHMRPPYDSTQETAGV